MHLPRPRTAILLVSLVTIAGCAPDPTPQLIGERVGKAAHPIADGYEDVEDTAVVGITWFEEMSLCTGSLLAPNVVLTARHCVSNIHNLIGGGIICGEATFGPVGSAEAFGVTATAEVTTATASDISVEQVVPLPGDDDGVCGNDVAILILEQNVPEAVAVPLIPAVSSEVSKDDIYSAVGYGATNEAGSGAGLRRRRDDLVVECVAGDCAPSAVTPTEWQGSEGVCGGDSGGPALDAQSQVLGITSRGMPNCADPVYGSVYSWRQWIKDTTVCAAGMGGYDPPSWTAGASVTAEACMPMGEACTVDGDCPTKQCHDDGTKKYCTRPCDDDTAPCPTDYQCDPSAHICTESSTPGPPPTPMVQRPDKDGCTVAAASGSPRGGLIWLGVAAAAVSLAAGRRRGRTALTPPAKDRISAKRWVARGDTAQPDPPLHGDVDGGQRGSSR